MLKVVTLRLFVNVPKQDQPELHLIIYLMIILLHLTKIQMRQRHKSKSIYRGEKYVLILFQQLPLSSVLSYVLWYVKCLNAYLNYYITFIRCIV